MKGKVFFVGAGPGSLDLLTVRAVRVLERADVVLHDDLVPQSIVELAREATVIHVGKRCGHHGTSQDAINRMMIEFARACRAVVRLKSGDPAIFGRLGEEIDSLRGAGIEFEVVPGVTAGLAAAAGAGISLTDRRFASSVIFTTASLARDGRQDFRALIGSGTTVVIYMPGRDYAQIATELRNAGAADGLPCAVISRAGTAEESISLATVGGLGEIASDAPSLIIVGEVVGAQPRSVAEQVTASPTSAS